MRTLLLALMLSAGTAFAQPDSTSFQTSAPWSPELDLQSDMAIVYGVNPSFQVRLDSWRAQGYTLGMMTGISWGRYGDYYMQDGRLKVEEIQTTKDGTVRMHGNSSTVGYNVPTPAYVAFIQQHIEPAIQEGVEHIFLEEPEFWANTGWSEGFKRIWQDRFGEPWQPPDTSPATQYRASRLKYELYFEALRDVMNHIDAKAAEKGLSIDVHVPTHSLVNYAQWRIVSPFTRLTDIPTMDGYIAQVWTGTARTHNRYNGRARERTFETAYLEYAQMTAMTRPTGRRVWFLADPIEDNPWRSWEDYKRNYEATITASLLHPEVADFEVMPWPNRIFRGEYPLTDQDIESGPRVDIPDEYATQVLVVINALNHITGEQDVTWDAGTEGIGVAVSDSMMFQRAQPNPSDPHLGSLYGQALPLLKHGVPVKLVQLENVPEALDGIRVLLLSYEHQKPLKPDYHDAIKAWVEGGGRLIYIGDNTDPYHHVAEWWNGNGQTDRTARDALLETLGVGEDACHEPKPLGQGFVRVHDRRADALANERGGADALLNMVREKMDLETQHYVRLDRGPFAIVSVFDEIEDEQALTLNGQYINLFDSMLRVITNPVLEPGQRAVFVDLERAANLGLDVPAAAARLIESRRSGNTLAFTTRGPLGITARARVLLQSPPVTITTQPEIPMRIEYDEASKTLWLEWENQAAPVEMRITAG